MFSLDILEVVIGLAFIYMILSLITTTVTELVAQFLSMRSSNMYEGIKILLHDVENTGLTRKFYDHPLIKSLAQQGRFLGTPRRPSYMNPHTFSLTLLDMLVNPGKSTAYKSVNDLRQIAAALQNSSILNDNPDLQRQLQVVLDGTKTIDEAHKAIEGWFNDMMDRASGWYKRKAQLVTLLVSIVVAVVFNGDTLSLFNRLTSDPAVRGALLGAAQNSLEQNLVLAPTPESTPEPGATPTPTTPDLAGAVQQISDLQQQINSTFQLVGWTFPPTAPTAPILTGLDENARQAAEDAYNTALDEYKRDYDAYLVSPLRLPSNTTEAVSKIIGLALTAIAISLGAPFWFDVLKKITNLRGSGTPPAEKPLPPQPPAPDAVVSNLVDPVIVTPPANPQGVINISAPKTDDADDGGVG